MDKGVSHDEMLTAGSKIKESEIYERGRFQLPSHQWKAPESEGGHVEAY